MGRDTAMPNFINFKSASDRLLAMGRSARHSTEPRSPAPSPPETSVNELNSDLSERGVRPASPVRRQPTRATEGLTLPRANSEAGTRLADTLPRANSEADTHLADTLPRANSEAGARLADTLLRTNSEADTRRLAAGPHSSLGTDTPRTTGLSGPRSSSGTDTPRTTGFVPPCPGSEVNTHSGDSDKPAPTKRVTPPLGLGLDGKKLHYMRNIGESLWTLPGSTGPLVADKPRIHRLDKPRAVGLLAGDQSIAVVTDSFVQLVKMDGEALRLGNVVGRGNKSITDKVCRNVPWMQAARSGSMLIQLNGSGFSGYDLSAEDKAPWHQSRSIHTMPRSVAVGSRFVAVQSRVGNSVALHCTDTGTQAFSLNLTGGMKTTRAPMAFSGNNLMVGLPNGQLEYFYPPYRLPKDVEAIPRQGFVQTDLEGPVTALASGSGGTVVGDKTGSLAIGTLEFDPARVNSVVVEHAHYDEVTAVAIHSELVASGGDDRSVNLWDRRSGSHLGSIGGFCGPIQSLVLTRDYLGVTTRKDPRVYFWSLTSEQ